MALQIGVKALTSAATRTRERPGSKLNRGLKCASLLCPCGAFGWMVFDMAWF